MKLNLTLLLAAGVLGGTLFVYAQSQATAPKLHVDAFTSRGQGVVMAADNVERALDFVNGESGAAAESLLTGVVFGRERLLATVRVIRDLPSEGEAP